MNQSLSHNSHHSLFYFLPLKYWTVVVFCVTNDQTLYAYFGTLDNHNNVFAFEMLL